MTIESPQSFERAIARARASTPPTVDAPKALDRSAFEHNAGDCGCGGGAACGGAGSCVCRVPGGGGDVYYRRMPDGTMQVVDSTTIAGATVTVPTLPPESQRPQDFPASEWERYRANGFPEDCVPYRDATRDALRMVPVVSDIVNIAADATETLTFAPPQGWLDAYYIDFAFYAATGVIDERLVDVSYPVVAGCNPSSCIPATPINGRFMTAQDGCCNGRPFRAIVQRAVDGGVLTVSVTNNTAGDITAQGVLRGFCISRRICA